MINSLDTNKLIAKPITKSSSMIDEKLHGRCLEFNASAARGGAKGWATTHLEIFGKCPILAL
jgi:hypothetical protein